MPLQRPVPALIAGALTCCLLLAIPARGADSPAPQSARAAVEPKVEELIKLVGEGRIDAMLERIGPIPDHERQSYQENREKLVAIYSNAGKYSGFDVAGFKTLTPRYVAAYVLVYFERRPVLFQFGFYRVGEKWRPQNFRVETDLHQLLDELPLQK